MQRWPPAFVVPERSRPKAAPLTVAAPSIMWTRAQRSVPIARSACAPADQLTASPTASCRFPDAPLSRRA
jgi:hypothetical protein